MKTFKDLEFKIEAGSFGYHFSARMSFDNGYEIFVSGFRLNENKWDVTVLRGGVVIAAVAGCLSEDEVTEIMERIQNL